MPKYATSPKMGKCEKPRKIKENQHIRRNANMIKILFVCHGSILKSPGKASKINGSAERNGTYYTTTTPF